MQKEKLSFFTSFSLSLSLSLSLYFLIMSKYRDEPIKRSNNTIIQWFGLDQFEPERAVSSNFVSSKTLFIIRVPLVLYSFVVLWIDIIWSIKTDQFRHFFAYFTDLTFIGLNAYLVVIWFSKRNMTMTNLCILDNSIPPRKVLMVYFIFITTS